MKPPLIVSNDGRRQIARTISTGLPGERSGNQKQGVYRLSKQRTRLCRVLVVKLLS